MKASLQLKNGIYQVIFSYKDFDGKHKVKWVSTGMKNGTGKRKLEEKRKEIFSAFEEEYNRKRYSADFQNGFRPMVRYKFADFMDIWLETVKPTLAHTTYYGLRRSEVLGLKWDAIDFENKTITIKHKVVNDYVDGTEKLICEDNLKNSASHRTLPLIPHIEKLLLEEKQKQEYCSSILLSGYNTDYSDYICKDNFGSLITPNFVTDHFRYVIKKHGMKKLRFHDLRHSCASLLLANGISMKQIQEWLGHFTYNVTANFYSHLEYTSKIASADAITGALG